MRGCKIVLSVCLVTAVLIVVGVGCRGGDRKDTVPAIPTKGEVSITAVPKPAQAPSVTRSIGEIASVWVQITGPGMNEEWHNLNYDPQTHEAKGVVWVPVGPDRRFHVEGCRKDGVAIYAGEQTVPVEAGKVTEVQVTITPISGPVEITANIHEVTGPPQIRLTNVPPIGSFERLRGEVRNINPNSVAVAVYIFVGGNWWTKPYWNAPKTPVKRDGTWVCDITTGGNDQMATKIRAYLIRKDYDPPLAPQVGLPPDPPTSEVLAMVEVTRQ